MIPKRHFLVAWVVLAGFSGWVRGEEVRGDRVIDRIFPFYSMRLGGGECAYDSARGRLVRFGGEADIPTREGGATLTSEWDGTNWLPIVTGSVPPVQMGFKMVYDAARSNIVLFGGYPATNSTWLYNGTNWTEATPATRPPSRSYHDMVYDSARSRVVMFGGALDPIFASDLNSRTNTFGDTWQWDGNDWTQIAAVTSPPACWAHQMVYDATRNLTLLYKGRVFNGVGFFGSLVIVNWLYPTNMWEYNGTNWSSVTPPSLPTGKGPLVYNPARGKVELWAFSTTAGGTSTNWTYDAGIWTPTVYTSGPKNDYDPSANFSEDTVSKDMDYLTPSGEAVFHLASRSASGDWLTGSGRTWHWSGSNWTCKTLFTPYYGTTTAMGEAAMDDVNGDGLPDRLLMGWIRNPTNDALTYGTALFLHDGTNITASPAWMKNSGLAYDATRIPWCVAMGDVTGDGLPDAVVGGSGNSSLQVFANIGGVFAPTNFWESGVRSNTVATLGLADVAGDPGLDLVVLAKAYGSASIWSVWVFTNNAGTWMTSPSFTYPLPLAPDSNPPAVDTQTSGSLRWGDIDYDGRAELAVAYWSAVSNSTDASAYFVDVLDVSEANLVRVTHLANARAPLAFTDVDLDLYPDLIATTAMGNDTDALALFPNVEGAIQTTPTWDAGFYELSPRHLAAGDCDGDGDPELAIGYKNIGEVTLCPSHMLYRNSSGQFESYPDWQAEENTGDQFVGGSVTLLDFDLDGVLDIITDKGVYLMDRLLRGRPPLPPRYAVAYAGGPGDTSVTVTWVASSDSTLVAYNVYGRSLLPSDAKLIGTVSAGQTSFVDTTPNAYNKYFITSVDEAGLESGMAETDYIAALPAARVGGDAKPDYSFSGLTQPQYWGGSDIYNRMQTGDVNGDGYLDIVQRRSHKSPLGTEYSWVLWLNTTNGFSKTWEPFWGASEPGAIVAMQDVDGDAKTELVLDRTRLVDMGGGSNEWRAVLEFWPAAGNGFATNTISELVLPLEFIQNSPHLRDLAFGDPDGDGDLDLAVLSSITAPNCQALLYLNNGTGVFASTPAWTSSVSNVTLLGFGHPNTNSVYGALALATFDTRTRVYIYNGEASGLSNSPAWYGTNLNAASQYASAVDGKTLRLDWSDFNSDGLPDLTICNSYDVYAYSNAAGAITSPGTGANATNYAFLAVSTGSLGGGFAHEKQGWGDVNGDGVMDLYGNRTVTLGAGNSFTGLITSANTTAPWTPVSYRINGEIWPYFIDPKWGLNGYFDQPMPTAVDIRRVADFNRDGIDDMILDYGNTIFLGGTNFAPTYGSVVATNFITLPSTRVNLEGPGATQALTIIAQLNNGTSTDVTFSASYTAYNRSGITVFTLSNNVITAVNASSWNWGDNWVDVIPDIRRAFVAGSAGTQLIPTPKVYVSVSSRPAEPVALRIVPEAPILTRQGAPLAFTVLATMEGGTDNDVTPLALFSNSAPSILSFAVPQGVPLQNGMATIIATYAGMSATSTVTVSLSTGLSSLELTPAQATIAPGGRQAFEITAHYGDSSSANVTFLGTLASSAPGVAVPVGNTVTGAAPGLAMIAASYSGKTSTASRVMVQDMSQGTNTPIHLEINDFAPESSNTRLGWYCTTPVGATNRFTVYTSTNLLTEAAWNPAVSNLPRWPTGFSSSSIPRNTNAPALFYRVGVDP